VFSAILVHRNWGYFTGKAAPIHEHDLIRLPNRTFLVFFAGYADGADKGWMATSDDLLTWTGYPGNPALPTPTAECGVYPNAVCWDGVHRRPRSLFQYKGMWYLLYEGTNTERWATDTGCWGDTIGIMRSKTLEGPWTERHPLQIVIPSQVPPPPDLFRGQAYAPPPPAADYHVAFRYRL